MVRWLACIWWVMLLFLAGCASSEMSARQNLAQSLAQSAGMSEQRITTDSFTITSFQRIRDPNQPVTFYIEGDGFAAAARNRISINPTPRDPLALRLAVKDTSANVVYLARPCQYTPLEEDRLCSQKYWFTHRLAPETVQALQQTVEKILHESSIKQGIHLVGYSGGAAMAVMIAAERNDVLSLRTVAGNLDHKAITDYHHVTPWDGSRNPIEDARAVASIPQRHFVGENDTIVTPMIAEGFAAKASNPACVTVEIVRGTTHHTGWVERWSSLLQEQPATPACATPNIQSSL